MYKKILFILITFLLVFFIWRYTTAPKMEVTLVDVQIRTGDSWRDLKDEYKDPQFFWVDASFRLHNPHKRKIEICVIQIPKEVLQSSKERRTFNDEYAHSFAPKETCTEKVSFIFSENDISKDGAVSLLLNSTFYAYTNDTYYDHEIFDQLENHVKAPFVAAIFGYRRSLVKSSLH